MGISNNLLIQFGTVLRPNVGIVQYGFATCFTDTTYTIVLGFEYAGSNTTLGYQEMGYSVKTVSGFTNSAIVTGNYMKYLTWIAIGH